MRYSLHKLDNHDVIATTIAADRDEALEWFSEKLRLMLTFEGDLVAADYVLDEWPEVLLGHALQIPAPIWYVGDTTSELLVRLNEPSHCSHVGSSQKIAADPNDKPESWAMTAMSTEMRKSGIDVVGDRWPGALIFVFSTRRKTISSTP